MLTGLVLLALIGAEARADVIPLEVDACRQVAEGEACTLPDGAIGSCQPSTCSRLDYSNGVPPSSVSYACLECRASDAVRTERPAAEPSEEPASPGCGARRAVSVGALLLLVGGLGQRRRSTASP